ncbi:MAG: sigma-70 family RNA polymerase sigma factor [Acidobacteriaceae bacterium]|nr:sigma-70 family RNA polymerase sigma factor [Acidobacteriaceae bacterium]
MSHCEDDVGPSHEAYRRLRDAFGFVPSVFDGLSSNPQALELHINLLIAVLCSDGDLSRVQKETISLVTARARSSVYGVTFHAHNLRTLGVRPNQLDRALAYSLTDLSTRQTALMDLAIALSQDPETDGVPRSSAAVRLGWAPQAVLDAVLSAAAGSLVCTLAAETSAVPDFPPIAVQAVGHAAESDREGDPLHAILGPTTQGLRGIPKLLQAQACRPGVLAAARKAYETVFRAGEPETLHVTSLYEFFRVVAFGVGLPDEIARGSISSGKMLHLAMRDSRPSKQHLEDPDEDLVSRAKGGDLTAFSELIHIYGRRVYRTLVGVLGDPDEALDAMQDTFLKAFQGLKQFQGRSRFSTWMITIATNTGIQRLRERVPTETLDENVQDRQSFRPKQIQGWTDNPEQLYSKQQTRVLVETAVRRLPAKYRVVVLLRDIEGMSTEEAAAALRLSVPALKARLLRGRLMLRESLASHFANEPAGVRP